jgi:predicted nucleic acid-binding protein
VTKKPAGLRAEPSFAGGVSFRYIETSALLAARLEHDPAASEAVRGEGRRFMSALTLAEAARRLIRSGRAGQLSPEQVRGALLWLRQFQRRCHTVDITAAILARVKRPFPIEPVRTLDAIHLATIESIEEDTSVVAVVTRDRRLAENARAMGYLVE